MGTKRGRVLVVFVARFDNKTGNALEWYETVWGGEAGGESNPSNQLPSLKSISRLSSASDAGIGFDPSGLEFKSMPSGIHNMDQDCLYFRHDALIGLSAFHRLMLPDSINNPSRNAQMISVGALSYSQECLSDCLPLLQATAARLNRIWTEISPKSEIPSSSASENQSLDFYSDLKRLLYREKRNIFNKHGEGNEDDEKYEIGNAGENETTKIGVSKLKFDQEYNVKDFVVPSFIFPSPILFSFFLLKFDILVITLWKLLLLRQRILIFSPPPVSLSCDFVSCICSLLHGASPSMTHVFTNGIKPNKNDPKLNSRNGHGIKNHENDNWNKDSVFSPTKSKPEIELPMEKDENSKSLSRDEILVSNPTSSQEEAIQVRKDSNRMPVSGMQMKKENSIDQMSVHYKDDLPTDLPRYVNDSPAVRKNSNLDFQPFNHSRTLPSLFPLFSVGLNDYDVLKETPFYVACTTDAILKHKTRLYDVLLEQRNDAWKLTIPNPELKKIVHVTPNDKLRWKEIKADLENIAFNKPGGNTNGENPPLSSLFPLSQLSIDLFSNSCSCCCLPSTEISDESLRDKLIESDHYNFIHFNPLDRISTMNICLGELIKHGIERNGRMWNQKPSSDMVQRLQEAKMDHRQDLPFLQCLMKMNSFNSLTDTVNASC